MTSHPCNRTCAVHVKSPFADFDCNFYREIVEKLGSLRVRTVCTGWVQKFCAYGVIAVVGYFHGRIVGEF